MDNDEFMERLLDGSSERSMLLAAFDKIGVLVREVQNSNESAKKLREENELLKADVQRHSSDKEELARALVAREIFNNRLERFVEEVGRQEASKSEYETQIQQLRNVADNLLTMNRLLSDRNSFLATQLEECWC